MKLKAVSTTLVIASLVPTLASCAKVNCDFEDENVERAIYEFLGKLPALRSPVVDDNPGGGATGVNISDFRMVGLNSLRPFGPFLTFCRGYSRIVQFDLINENPLHIMGSIRRPDGFPLEMDATALVVRLTSQFTVTGSGENVELHPERNLPVSLVGLSLRIEGLDDDINEKVTAAINSVKSGFLSTMWNAVLFHVLEKVFNEILHK
ncbi:uncharacterized protein LOC144166378 [Haemaphysalis longicornis]